MSVVPQRVSFVDGSSAANTDFSSVVKRAPNLFTSNTTETSVQLSKRRSFFDFVPTLSLQRQSSLSPTQTARAQFRTLLNEHISPQHKQHFAHYFDNVKPDKTFSVEEFCKIIQVTPILGERLLKIFERQNSFQTNTIFGEDIIRMTRLLWISSMPVKAYIFFRLIAKDGSDLVTVDDIRMFYNRYLAEFKFPHNAEKRQQIVDIFLRGLKIDEETNRQLTFERFYDILHQHPHVFESLYLISIPNRHSQIDDEPRGLQRISMYVKNNMNRISWRIGYALVTVALIVQVIIHRINHEKNINAWKVIARIGGRMINFNYALAILLMLKQTMTVIRRTQWLRRFIPIDDHIDAHRIVGKMLAFWTIVHVVGHVGNYTSNTSELTWTQSMFTTAAGHGWIYNLAPITGDILVLLLTVMVVCSLQCIRQRNGCFPLFRYTHQIFWLLFILLIIHAREFWKWTVGPMGLFILEKLYAYKRYFPSYGKTRLLSVTIEDENVVTLIMERPANFRYKTGDYVYISFPKIAFNDWHPFTLSSSPKQNGILRLHIMKKKNWTRKVYEYFSDIHDRQHENSPHLNEIVIGSQREISRTCSVGRKVIRMPTKVDIRIEGPYSSSTSYIFDCDHVVLIGGGIGITPYVSALESLIHKFRSEQHTCSQCSHIDQDDTLFNQRKLKKVDFIWINREVKNFAWFIKLLEEFEAEQERYLAGGHGRIRYLDIHLYFTALANQGQSMVDIAPYDIVANVYASVCQEDIHTTLKTVRTKVGRPPWRLLFAEFKADQKPGLTTNVFFTGNAMMGAEIKRNCDEQRFPFFHEPYF